MEQTLKTKFCTGCGRDLPAEAFGHSKNTTDGLAHRCKECVNRAKREYTRSKKKLNRVYTNPELAQFTPRQLIDELKARGYYGELKVTQTIKV